MPITKFIMLSLPLDKLIQDSQQPPRAIDYACGAGHFLNELALQLKPSVEKHRPNDDLNTYYQGVYGIEKEYRLSKVAKVSAFMYGQKDIRIVYADALAYNDQITDGTFSLLVANPPYSVKGFLETLPEIDRKRYTLYDTIDPKTLAKNNAIETFFIERAKQLLQPGGMAAIIVPSSILSNTKTLYVRTREILIQNFDIVAIAELGSGTFGKTGTNTVTLFLRRKEENPAPADHYRNRVDTWFKGRTDKNSLFADEHIIHNYCEHIDIAFDQYQTLLNGKLSADLLAYDLYADYKRDFENLTDTKNLRKGKQFRALGPNEQQTVVDGRFLNYLRHVEKDKLYHYAMAQTNPQPVVIIKSPSDNKEQKQFLGYEWSSAKGNEGIKYLAGTRSAKPKPAPDEVGEEEDEDVLVLENLNNLEHIQTALYDPQDGQNPDKLNYAIQQAFLGESVDIPDALQPYLTTARLVDMLDFGRKDFNKSFSLSPAKRNVTINTKWPVEKLSNVVSIIGGGTPNTSVQDYWNGNIPWLSVVDFNNDERFVSTSEKTISAEGLKNSSAKYLDPGDLIISARGTVGAMAQVAIPMTFNQSCYGLRSKSQVNSGYLYYVLKQEIEQFKANAFGSKFDSITTNTFDSIKIPLPPLEVQTQIVTECEAVDAEVSEAKEVIADAKREVEEQLQAIADQGYPEQKLAELTTINPSKTEIRDLDGSTLVSFVEMAAVSNDGFIERTEARPLRDLKKGSYTYFRENDIIIAKITPCMENGKCALATGLTNGLAMGSSEFHVIRTKSSVLDHYMFALLNRDVVRKQAEQNMTGSSGHRRVPASFYENYRIPVPPLTEQQALIGRVEAQKRRIAAAQAIVDGAAARKQAVLKQHL